MKNSLYKNLDNQKIIFIFCKNSLKFIKIIKNKINKKMVEKIHDYKFISKLGKGTFSDIYLVKGIKDLKYFAMKIINKTLLDNL